MEPIITVSHISKRYNITHQQGGYVMLRDVLMNIVRRPMRFLQTKAKAAVGLASTEEFWALKDISFTVNRGEVIGIIGSNGAGKSTLLKILSQITPPTEGEVILRGRVSSLLEVGTGFHPELTGRENIFLNGAILGMTRREIARRFDEIVAFAGVEQFLDTPVKYYSSGMYVRLAFSVAAHIEPDILIVDEVLAVGDAEFQKKCLGKMEEVTKKEGRTILFVSHNMAAIQTLCRKSLLLQKGKVVAYGDTDEVIDRYLKPRGSLNATTEYRIDPRPHVQITKVTFFGHDGKLCANLPGDKPFTIRAEYAVKRPVHEATVSLLFNGRAGEKILFASECDRKGQMYNHEPGTYATTANVPAHFFNAGEYTLDVTIHHPYVEYYDQKVGIPFEIVPTPTPRSVIMKGHVVGLMATILDFHTERQDEVKFV